MSNIYNEQRAEQMFEEMVEDNISKESLVEVLDFIKKYLVACQNHGIKEYFLISIKVRVTYHSFNSIS